MGKKGNFFALLCKKKGKQKNTLFNEWKNHYWRKYLLARYCTMLYIQSYNKSTQHDLMTSSATNTLNMRFFVLFNIRFRCIQHKLGVEGFFFFFGLVRIEHIIYLQPTQQHNIYNIGVSVNIENILCQAKNKFCVFFLLKRRGIYIYCLCWINKFTH